MKKTKKIEVAVRMRPLLQEFEDVEAWTVNEEQGRVSSIPKGQVGRGGIEEGLGRRKSKVEMNNIYEFSLDYVFKDIHSNWQVYSQCSSRVVQDFLAGNNATIFMYGQTTTGKTYTMLGDQRTEGLIIYSLRDIFTSKAPGTHIDISYLEIYNEQINDLLKQGSVNLKIVDQNVQGLSQCTVTNMQQALQLLNEGQYQRSYAEKKCHDHSSRSHTIFQKLMDQSTKPKAVLNLVDLSGSERLADEENTEETAYINKSLFVLSNVINKLANPKKSTHIPFRDSKLTRLLAHSLTTSKKTLIICTISPAEINFTQTLSTLRFATQSRKIELKGLDESMNQSLEVNRKKISQLIQENSLLKKNLSFAQDNKENQMRFVSGKAKNLEEMIQKQEIRVGSTYRLGEWKRKVNTLCEEYEKNIEILQKEYLKAIINLTANELCVGKQTVKNLLEKQEN